MNGQLLLQGFELLLLGMGIVFGFLTLLVFMLRAMSGLAARLTPAETSPAEVPESTARVDDRQLLAVITAAIARYRAGRSR